MGYRNIKEKRDKMDWVIAYRIKVRTVNRSLLITIKQKSRGSRFPRLGKYYSKATINVGLVVSLESIHGIVDHGLENRHELFPSLDGCVERQNLDPHVPVGQMELGDSLLMGQGLDGLDLHDPIADGLSW